MTHCKNQVSLPTFSQPERKPRTCPTLMHKPNIIFDEFAFVVLVGHYFALPYKHQVTAYDSLVTPTFALNSLYHLSIKRLSKKAFGVDMKKIAPHKFKVRTTSLASRRNKNRKKKFRVELIVQTFWDSGQFKLSFYSDVCTSAFSLKSTS